MSPRRARARPPAPPARRARVWIVLAVGVTAVAMVLALSWLGRRRSQGKGASVLLVTIDTLRADHVGAYGARTGATPNLDALAARGLLFEEAVSSVPLTLPSHATLLSGLEPPHHGLRDNGTGVFPAAPPTLATILKANGYATAAFVAAYVLDRRFGLARGFDHYDDRIDRREEGVSTLESERRCDEVVTAAGTWIAAQPERFFAWAHFYEPHAPYDPPQPFRERQAGRPYDGEVASADACLGALVAAAEAHAKGRLVVAVLSDHGEALGDHGELTHGFFVYEATLRVPFVIAGAGLRQGERRRGLARTVDLLPTLLGRLGLAAPPGLDGSDLLTGPVPREAYGETLYPETLGWAGLRALRIGPLKYIEAPRPELYDLARDPGEARNLVAVRPEDAARLRAALGRMGAGRMSGGGTIDAEVAERLRALGYVGATEQPRSGLGRRDPKDALSLWRRFEEATWTDARGDHEAAARGFRDLVASDPVNPAFRGSLAAALRKAGHAREAAAALEDLERTAPSDAVAWHERAMSLAAAGAIDDAIRAEERASALNPLLPEPQNHLGVLQARRGHDQEALSAFVRATDLDPNNGRAWNNRANALRALGRVPAAIEAYRTAMAVSPRDPDPRNGLGVLLVQSGDAVGAVALFREALAFASARGDIRLNLAVAQVQAGDAPGARGTLRELLRGRSDPETARRAAALLSDLDR